MPATTTLPIMAGLSILAAAVGISLGRSAIAEINPAYFSDPEESFHSDLVPYRSPDWAQVHAAEYRAAQQPVLVGDLGSGCIGCRDYPVEYVPVHDPAVEGYHPEPYAASVPQPAQVVIVETPAAADPDRDRIQLYSSYPVSGEESPARDEPAAAADGIEPTGL
ncbi:MAG TPA: hypothetical protein VEA61_14885 [Allosphingosinicella sp.]|nr:hypothetical protein [Allosphingosinicella sp.]